MELNLKYYNDEKIELQERKKISKDVDITTSKNILNWYPFKENTSILELGDNSYGEITKLLCKRASKVTYIEYSLENAKIVQDKNKERDNLEIIVGKFNDIQINQKYDYIILIGSLPYLAKQNNMSSKEFINNLNNILNPDGKILIAVDNKFGLKYFVGDSENYLQKKFVSILNYNNEENKIETFTRESLIKMLEECGYEGHNFYYPLPDYKLPNVIFSDKELPKYNTIDKYVPYYNDNATILINEIDLYREILRTNENLFTFFANAYLVEASKIKEDIKYKYISYNNIRKPKYRLITKISDEYVEKAQIEEITKTHYEQIKENIDILNKAKINTVDEIKNEKIRSLYIDNRNLLSVVLTQKLERKEYERFYNIIDNYYKELEKVSEKIDNNDETIFERYNIQITEELKQSLNFVKVALWDMTFKNCFFIDGKYYFFDQEWKANNMPLEYVLYRAILYTISLRRFININEIFKKYNLDKYLNIFNELDAKLQEEIRDDNQWKYYSKNYSYDIDANKQEMINMKKEIMQKGLQIENLTKKLEKYESGKIITFIKYKIKRKFRRNNKND